MAIPIVHQGDVVELRILGEQLSGRTITTLHYMQDQVPSGGISLDGWWTSWQLWASAPPGDFWQKLAAVTSVSWKTQQQAVQIVAPTRSPYILHNFTLAGLIAGTPAAGFQCVEFIKQTNVAGKGFSGRLYLPGFPTSWQNLDSIANVAGAALDDFGTALMTNVSMAPDGGTAVPIVWSHRRAQDRHTIFKVYFNPLIKTLHRRLKGKGI